MEAQGIFQLADALTKAGFDGPGLAASVFGVYNLGSPGCELHTQVKIDRERVQFQLYFEFGRGGRVTFGAVDACLLSERLKRFSLPPAERYPVWKTYFGFTDINEIGKNLREERSRRIQIQADQLKEGRKPMFTVETLEKELSENGYDGQRIARSVAAAYDSGKLNYVHETGAKTADKQVLMIALDMRFLPGREFEIRGLSACLLKDRLEQFGVLPEKQDKIWKEFPGLPTLESVANALNGHVRYLEMNSINQLTHKNLTIMNLNNLERLQEELKTLGFTPKTAEAMQQQMEKGVPDFRLHEKVMGDKGQVDLTLHFKQSSQSEHYYFNKFEVALNTGKPLEEGQKYMVITPNEKEPGKNLVKPFENVTEAVEFFKEQKGNSILAVGKDAAHKVDLAKMENGKNNYVAKDFQRTYNTPAITQTFFVQNGKGFTAEQSANLIQNRAVFRDDLLKLSGEPYAAWVKLDREQPKDEYKNFVLTQWSVPNYGFILRDTLEKFNIKEMNEPAKAEKLAHALENGHRPLVTVVKDGQESKLFLETSPRFSQLNFFREDGKAEKREQFLKEPAKAQKVEVSKGQGKEKDQEKELAPGR